VSGHCHAAVQDLLFLGHRMVLDVCCLRVLFDGEVHLCHLEAYPAHTVVTAMMQSVPWLIATGIVVLVLFGGVQGTCPELT
jgi:hypothetical protein